MKKEKELEEDQLILRKRQDFLNLVTQGLQRWRGSSDQEKLARKEDSNTSWGRELGLRKYSKLLLSFNFKIAGVRKILDETRRKNQLKRNKDFGLLDTSNGADDRQDSVAISWGRLLGKRKYFYLNVEIFLYWSVTRYQGRLGRSSEERSDETT